MTEREALLELIDALLRKGTEQDGNWGFPSFHEQLRLIRHRLIEDSQSAALVQPSKEKS